ncbi:MAG: hypothetical protein IJR29_11495 [Butyrivibrio sp.]|nr:hypothetical protein [Butyrivibrio sp.]
MSDFKTLITGLFGTAYGLWNSIITIAMTLFTTSPTSANGSVYTTTYNLYSAIQDIALPIAIIFFLIGLLKDVISAPPDQQVRKFAGDGIKFGIMVGILANLWTIMGYIMQIADGVTASFGAANDYQMEISDEMEAIIDEMLTAPEWEYSGLMNLLSNLKEFWDGYLSYFLASILLMIIGFVTIIIMVASAISILSSAIQRIIKPLVILPFACITVAMATGAQDASRVTVSYLKTFFGFCLSGAFMVIAVNLGTALCSGLIAVAGDGSTVGNAITICMQSAVTPIMIAGLIKSTDSIIARFF